MDIRKPVCQFARATVTRCFKQGDLKNGNSLPHSSDS